MPLSWSQVVPVISPLPFSVNHAPKTGSALGLAARMDDGDTRAHRALPDDEAALARDQRRVPDLHAATSVIASSGPGVPPMSALIPSSRARSGAAL